jgi:hypothetical protein
MRCWPTGGAMAATQRTSSVVPPSQRSAISCRFWRSRRRHRSKWPRSSRAPPCLMVSLHRQARRRLDSRARSHQPAAAAAAAAAAVSVEQCLSARQLQQAPSCLKKFQRVSCSSLGLLVVERPHSCADGPRRQQRRHQQQQTLLQVALLKTGRSKTLCGTQPWRSSRSSVT